MEKKLKRYGRTKINKLDWLLAITFVVFAIGALSIAIGVLVSKAQEPALEGLKQFVNAIGFQFKGATVLRVLVAVLFYESLLTLILGIYYCVKKEHKDRIPGVVGQFIAAIGVAILFCLVIQFLKYSRSSMNLFWPISLLIFVICLACLLIVNVYMAFNQDVNVNLEEEEEEKEEEPVIEAAPVYEEIKEEEPEEEEPAPAPVMEEVEKEEEPVEEIPEEEEEAEEEEPEEEKEEEDEPAEGEEDQFANLGKRRKRIPFENKIKRSKPETRERYKQIVAALREYDFNDRKSIPCETFSYKKEKMVVLTFSGQTLKAYFRLKPQDFADSPIPVKDASEIKKFADVPVYIIIKSDLAARRVIALAQRVIDEFAIPKK